MQFTDDCEIEDCQQRFDSKVIRQLWLAGDLKDCVKQVSRDTLEELFLDLLEHIIKTNDWLKSMEGKDAR